MISSHNSCLLLLQQASAVRGLLCWMAKCPRRIQNLITRYNKPLRWYLRRKKFHFSCRPSGTEDVVRVYAEANQSQDVIRLAYGVAQIVYDLCNGVGDRPTMPQSF